MGDAARLARPAPAGGAWLLVAAALAGAAVLASAATDTGAFEWRPERAAAEPWRAWTAVAVHYSRLHLAANLAGAALVAALGAVARVPGRSAVAWAAAWPLTQLGLVALPQLARYGGLSGVLHAGVAVVAVHLLAATHGAPRAIGAALLAGLAAKVASESPWGTPLRYPAGWDIAVAPFAHLSGLAAGALCSAAAEATGLRRKQRTGQEP